MRFGHSSSSGLAVETLKYGTMKTNLNIYCELVDGVEPMRDKCVAESKFHTGEIKNLRFR